MVAAGKANVSTFVTPATANYIRFQTFAADASASAHDLDMFVYRAPPAPAAETYALIATSGGPDVNENVVTTSAGSLATGARFKVYVHACGVDAPGGSYVLNSWALTSPSSNPFTTVPPAQAVSVGQVIPTTFGWTGLPPGTAIWAACKRSIRRFREWRCRRRWCSSTPARPTRKANDTRGRQTPAPRRFPPPAAPGGMQTGLAWLCHPT